MARKGENIFYRKDGRWEARYIKGKDNYGKNIYGYVYGKTYQDAKNKRIEALLNISHNIIKEDNGLFKIKTYEWLKINKVTLKTSTFNYYSGIINKHILPIFGDFKINQITEIMIYDFMYDKKRHLNETTVKQIMVILKALLKYVGLNYDIKLPKIHKKVIDVLSNTEIKKLHNYAISNINQYTLGILISLYTGLRLGEICALKWSNIDFESKLLTVNNTLTRVKINDINSIKKTKLILNTAKTDNSIRIIPLNKVIIKYLENYKNKRNISDEAFVLTNSLKLVDSRTFYYNYKKILKKLGMPDYTFHILRHTFATRCCYLGFDIKSLSEVLGHSNIKTTLSIYVHPNLEYKKKFFDNAFINY